MRLTNVQALIIILVVSLGTQVTRWLPFVLFPEQKEPPAVVAYLGKVLPPAMMGLLVVYCFKAFPGFPAPTGSRNSSPRQWWCCSIAGNGTCWRPLPAARRSICCWCSLFSHKADKAA